MKNLNIKDFYGKDEALTRLIKTQREHPEFISIYDGRTWTFYRQNLSSYHPLIEKLRHFILSIFSFINDYHEKNQKCLEKLIHSKNLYEAALENDDKGDIKPLIEKRKKFNEDLRLNTESQQQLIKQIIALESKILTEQNKQTLLEQNHASRLKNLEREKILLMENESSLQLLDSSEKEKEKLEKEQSQLETRNKFLSGSLKFLKKNNPPYVITSTTDHTEIGFDHKFNQDYIDQKKEFERNQGSLNALKAQIAQFVFPIRKQLPMPLRSKSAAFQLQRLSQLPQDIQNLENQHQARKKEIQNSIALLNENLLSQKNCLHSLQLERTQTETKVKQVETDLKEKFKATEQLFPNHIDDFLKLIEEKKNLEDGYKTLKTRTAYLASLGLPKQEYTHSIGEQLINSDLKLSELKFLLA